MNDTPYAVLAPQDMNPMFARAFNSADIENLLALYEPEGQLVRQDGQVDVGLDAVRDNLQNFLRLGGMMTSENVYAVVSGDLALLRARWRLTTTTPDGQPLSLEGHTAEVVRRQPDGRWLYVVDHPFGAEPL
ncbi:YybH family protein [Deinococcus sp.]|uniref:YybH family protein n=1 Tax=Deinococcus sp. TaxID=47478 RepID=UPI003CC5C5CC